MRASLTCAVLFVWASGAHAQAKLAVTAADPLPQQYRGIATDVRDGMRPLLEVAPMATLLMGNARLFDARIFQSSLVVLVNVPMPEPDPPCRLANSVLLNAVEVDALNHKYQRNLVMSAVQQVPWRAGCLAADYVYGTRLMQRLRVVGDRLLLEADYGLVRPWRYRLHAGSAAPTSVRALERSYDRRNPGTYLAPSNDVRFSEDVLRRLAQAELKLSVEGVASGFVSQGSRR